MTRVAYLPGDGIGPEVCAVAKSTLTAAGFQAEWQDLRIGWNEWCQNGDPLPPSTLSALRSCDAALLGAITSKPDDAAQKELSPALRGKGLRYRSPIVRLRQELDLFTNLRPVRSFHGNPNNLSPRVDIVIFRENTEDLYAGLEVRPFPETLRAAWLAAQPNAPVPLAGDGTAITARVITRRATQRIMEAAFEYAKKQGCRKITLVEKPNVMRATGGLVREVFLDMAARYPGIGTEEQNVDAACALVVRKPESFDVVVATNLFGDIFSDVAAEVAGGLPLAASGNIGPTLGVFEPVHGSAPDIAGKGVANPLGAVLAAAMLARHVGQDAVATRLEGAVAKVIEGPVRPRDLGGSAGTKAIEEALVAALHARANVRTPA